MHRMTSSDPGLKEQKTAGGAGAMLTALSEFLPLAVVKRKATDRSSSRFPVMDL